MTGNVIIAGGDVAPTTPRRDEHMEIGILMSITKDQERHVCEEMEPRVNYDKLAGDGVYRDAYTGEELDKELVTNGRQTDMKSMEEQTRLLASAMTTGRGSSSLDPLAPLIGKGVDLDEDTVRQQLASCWQDAIAADG